jgi:putative DNA primase/helicase
MLDFNDSENPPVPTAAADRQREEIRATLLARLESVLMTMFPAGKARRGKFYIGDILGSPGDSLEIVLTGDKAGLWTDRENGSGGDQYDLIGGHFGISVQTDFPAVLAKAAELLGQAAPIAARKRKVEAPTDDLGKATAKWDYLDAAGKLIAIVYRYDPPGQKKEYRPWDVKRKKAAPPSPRPLYNQVGMLNADQVVLVEGEKCAKALIDAGICATTAMFGANAPVDKTDWSPLAGKAVIIWPDNDEPGLAYAHAAGQAVLVAGALSCAVLQPPPDRPKGWDCADALQASIDGAPESVFDVAGFVRSGLRLALPKISLGTGNPQSDRELLQDVDWQTEDGLCTAFTRRYGKDWRYCAQWGKWYVWTGQRWNEDLVLFINHLIRGVCRAASRKASSARTKAKLASASTISAVERMARSEPVHAALADDWDANVWLVNTPLGVVDLHDGQTRPPRREDLMTKITTASPVWGTGCPNWLAFLDQVTGGDSELVRYLQRMFGYCLTGSTQEHALFFLYGTGANGKSVFINVLSTILGDYASNAPMDTFMESRGDRHPTDLAGLRGSRLVSATETEQGRRWAESKVKEITGGDPVSARFMRQDFFTFYPRFKLLIAGNHKPTIRNIDEAMRRRLHLVPFTITVPPEKRDKHLQSKLLMERDAILAWGLQGCLQWQKTGLQPPKCVLDATEEYFDEEDAVGEFLEDDCQRSAHSKESIAAVYQRWKERAERRGEYVGSSRWLTQQLLARGFERDRLGSGAKAIKGLYLRARGTDYALPYSDN